MTIPKSIFQNDDLVIVPRKHYEELRANQIPVYFLTGRAAKRLDKRVASSLRAYRMGKCQKIESLSELM
jgi:hypothetical protein